MPTRKQGPAKQPINGNGALSLILQLPKVSRAHKNQYPALHAISKQMF